MINNTEGNAGKPFKLKLFSTNSPFLFASPEINLGLTTDSKMFVLVVHK